MVIYEQELEIIKKSHLWRDRSTEITSPTFTKYWSFQGDKKNLVEGELKEQKVTTTYRPMRLLKFPMD